jgi:hypothetical protein
VWYVQEVPKIWLQISSAFFTLPVVSVTLQPDLNYASHFVASISDVLFSFYFRFCDQVCCCPVMFSMQLVKEQRICVKFASDYGKQLQKPTAYCMKLMVIMPPVK